MERQRIVLGDFEREYKNFLYRNGYSSIFENELNIEPVKDIIVVSGIKLSEFRYDILKPELDYTINPLFVGRRGEDSRAVKYIGDERILPIILESIPKKYQRHLKMWYPDEGMGIIITAHDELSPANIFVSPIKTLGVHLRKGQGDYESGTEGFWEELEEKVSSTIKN